MPPRDASAVRAAFLQGIRDAMRTIWPILSVLLVLQVALGSVIGLVEGWGLGAGVYLAFVTGLTIGYGDLAPATILTRVLAVAIGFLGVILTGLVAALAVAALTRAAKVWPRQRIARLLGRRLIYRP
jgi:hypothetical protein